MPDRSAFSIAMRWPAKHADRLQPYSLPTSNGVKVSIMLEETGLPYEAHRIDIGANESWAEPFLSLDPNGKIPAIIGPMFGRPGYFYQIDLREIADDDRLKNVPAWLARGLVRPAVQRGLEIPPRQ